MIIIYSESRGQFLGETDWISTTFCAKGFHSVEEARHELEKRTPEGKTESVAFLNFISREVHGLRELFTSGARRHYAKMVSKKKIWINTTKFTELLSEALNAVVIDVPLEGSIGGNVNDAVLIKRADIIHNSAIGIELNTGELFVLSITDLSGRA